MIPKAQRQKMLRLRFQRIERERNEGLCFDVDEMVKLNKGNDNFIPANRNKEVPETRRILDCYYPFLSSISSNNVHYSSKWHDEQYK